MINLGNENMDQYSSNYLYKMITTRVSSVQM
jgi:hypothetical protein